MADDLIKALMVEQQIPGIAIGIQSGDTIVYEQYAGMANLEHSVPVQQDTVFEIASVTKLFTTQAILRLAQDKRLQLDDPLHQHLADLPPAWQPVTIRHCLSHQSGIPSYTDPARYWEITRVAKSHADILALVRDLPTHFAPGARYSYDNTGYYLLGMVIEAVAQKPYGDYLHDIIFAPLGMTHTRANDYDAIVPHRAQGYELREGTHYNKAFYDISNTFSAGVLLSSVRDLLAWRASLYGDHVLDAAQRKLWWTPHPSQAANERAHQFSVGLGWFILDHALGTFYGHNGGIAGFASALLHFAHNDVTAVVLCSAPQVNEPHQIALKIIQAMGL